LDDEGIDADVRIDKDIEIISKFASMFKKKLRRKL
jgi:hypothetical protein